MKPPRGLVIVNTGDGKGKTTAAFGMMLRAWGNGLKVVMLQFVKSPDREYGEVKAARKIGLEVITGGAGFYFPGMDEAPHKAAAIEQWVVAREKISAGGYDMVILDELTYALRFGWVPVEELIDVLKGRPPGMHVVITGRAAPRPLTDFADTVSEINDIKHHFRQGIKAQPGVEL